MANRLFNTRYGHTAVTCGDAMYVFGGFNNTAGTNNDVYRFSFGALAFFSPNDARILTSDASEWELLRCGGAVPNPRFFHSAVVHGRAMYVFGGHSGHGGTSFNDVCRLDLGAPGSIACHLRFRRG